MTKFSSHIRWKIIEKSLTGLSERLIATHLGISKTTVNRVCHHFKKKYGCIESLLSLRGRSRIFGSDDMKYLETLLKEKVDWYIWEIHSQMELWLGRNIDLSTIWRAVYRLGYTHKQVFHIILL
jgi:transposase